MKTHSRRISINETVVCAELDAEAILLNVETGIYYGLNAIGTSIWQLLTQGLDEREIMTKLLEEYDVSPERLQSDIDTFFRALTERGLAQVADGAGS